MAETTYRQCLLRKGAQQMVTWIPSRHGGVDIAEGMEITLRGLEGVYTVVRVFPAERTPEEVSWWAKMYENWRETTDV